MDPMGTENDLYRENESSTSHASEEDDENASWSARILLRAAQIEVFSNHPTFWWPVSTFLESEKSGSFSKLKVWKETSVWTCKNRVLKGGVFIPLIFQNVP